MIPRRRKKARMGLRKTSLVRCPGHLKWVRGHECAAAGVTCDGRIEAHHLQSYRAIEGGMGLKVGDDKTVPLCVIHHHEIHLNGQLAFEYWTKTNLEATAAALWAQSPAGKRYRMQEQASLDAPNESGLSDRGNGVALMGSKEGEAK